MSRRILLSLSVFMALAYCSCNNGSMSSSHGPIILGNPHTIVTDSDTQDLQDVVPDLQPVTPADEKTADTGAPDTGKQKEQAPQTTADQPTKPQQPQPKPAGNGLNVPFDNVTIQIPNVVAKGNNNFKPKSNGATYQMVSGNLTNNQMMISGNVTRVSQRYQTMIVVKNGLGTLPLQSLTTITNWQPLRSGGKGSYSISGLDPSRLSYNNARPSEIRNAITRETRKHRVDRKKEQEWVNSVRNVRAANQRPCMVVLRSVEWKIEGKDANGKPYQKQLRLDMPMPQ